MKSIFTKHDAGSIKAEYEMPRETENGKTEFPSQVRRNIDNLLKVNGLSPTEAATAQRASNLNPEEGLRDEFFDPGEELLINRAKKFTGEEVKNTKPLLERLIDISALRPAPEYELPKSPELCRFEQELPSSMDELEVTLPESLAQRLVDKPPKAYYQGMSWIAYGIVRNNLEEHKESTEPLFESSEVEIMEKAMVEARARANSTLNATFHIPELGSSDEPLKSEGVELRLVSTVDIEQDTVDAGAEIPDNYLKSTGDAFQTTSTPRITRKEVVRKRRVEIQLPPGATAIFIDPYGKGELKIEGSKHDFAGSTRLDLAHYDEVFRPEKAVKLAGDHARQFELQSSTLPPHSSESESAWVEIPGLKPGHHIVEIRLAGQKVPNRYPIYVPPFEVRESFDLRDRCACSVQDTKGKEIPSSIFASPIRMPAGVYQIPDTDFQLRVYGNHCASLAQGDHERFFVPDSKDGWVLSDPSLSSVESSSGIGIYAMRKEKKASDPFDFGPGKTVSLQFPTLPSSYSGFTLPSSYSGFSINAKPQRSGFRPAPDFLHIRGLSKDKVTIESDKHRVG